MLARPTTKNPEQNARVYTSRPRVANTHLFRSGDQDMMLSVTSGSIYSLFDTLAENIDCAMDHGDEDRVQQFLTAVRIFDDPVAEEPPASIRPRALSLAVAQKCNLGCTYCYAQQGDFGAPANSMPEDIAFAAIDGLIDKTPRGGSVSLSFLGGEPLANRPVLRAATEYAANKAGACGVAVSFAVTTNGTMLSDDDAEFLDRYGFVVTISIDGDRETHDRLRPFKSGAGSYDRVIARTRVLLSLKQRRCRVLARVTVTPRNLRLRDTLDELLSMGFDSVTFSPVLNSPSGTDQMGNSEFDELLSQMIDCGRVFEDRFGKDEIYPFSNMIRILGKIHRRERDAYPCGAGGGYFGVSSEGGMYACHRFVGDERAALGDVTSGVDGVKQRIWLSERNVHQQPPCKTCWARYLCGGGCHHEVINAGRPACDFIRGWLHYCLGVYVELSSKYPKRLQGLLEYGTTGET